MPERDQLEVDVLFVGAGPASGLDAARQSLAEIESSLAQVELRLTAALQARELTPVTGP